MIDERTEPDTTEEIEHEINPSEHPSDEDRMCLDIEPEGDCKPDEHIRESSDCSVDEDVGEEGRWVHYFIVSIISVVSDGARHCEARSNPEYFSVKRIIIEYEFNFLLKNHPHES